MQNRRRFPRTKCFKGAKILSHNHAAVPCIVRDISVEGAGLQLPATLLCLPSSTSAWIPDVGCGNAASCGARQKRWGSGSRRRKPAIRPWNLETRRGYPQQVWA
jgi:hypothetical protein